MIDVNIELAIAICNLQKTLCRKLNKEGGKACPNWTEFSILQSLQREPGESIQAVASSANLTSGSATYTIDRLETSGFIERKRDSNDSRVSNIYLTQAGESALIAMRKKLSEVSREVFEGIIEERKIDILGDLKKSQEIHPGNDALIAT